MLKLVLIAEDTTLDEAEEAMLDLYVQRADLQNGA
jgi:hypothetical protein